MPETPTTTSPSRGTEAERVRAAQPPGTERTRERPLYAPRVDIVETGTRSRCWPTCPA